MCFQVSSSLIGHLAEAEFDPHFLDPSLSAIRAITSELNRPLPLSSQSNPLLFLYLSTSVWTITILLLLSPNAHYRSKSIQVFPWDFGLHSELGGRLVDNLPSD